MKLFFSFFFSSLKRQYVFELCDVLVSRVPVQKLSVPLTDISGRKRWKERDEGIWISRIIQEELSVYGWGMSVVIRCGTSVKCSRVRKAEVDHYMRLF